MIIKTATFIKSCKILSQCTKPDKPEFAFIGRSNVGKSSLINTLTKNNGLAKISVKPGKTRLINFFLINDNTYLVDIPGLGYASVPKTLRLEWEKMIRNYILKRDNLMNLYYLVDSRLSPQEIDLEFINWCGLNQVPLSLVFTKTDKESQKVIQKNISTFNNKLLETWTSLPTFFATSSVSKVGIDKLTDHIEEVSKLFNYDENE